MLQRGLLWVRSSPGPASRGGTISYTATTDLSEDREWLKGFFAGEAVALERVFRTYAPYVYALLTKNILTSQTSEDARDDLLQEVFCRLLCSQTRKSYDGLRPYGAFISGVTRHVCLEWQRKQGRRQKRFKPMLPEAELEQYETWQPGQPLPEQALLSAEETALMAKFLATLPAHESEFVELRFQQALSQRQVADTLQTGRQQVRSWEKSIREKLAGFLQQNGFEVG